MTTQRLRRGHELRLRLTAIYTALLPAALLFPAESRASEQGGPAPAAGPKAAPVPGFDAVEHRFGLSLGFARVASVGIDAWLGRVEYTFAWGGWGAGVGFALDTHHDSVGGETLTLGGLHLRRGVLLGDGRLFGSLELGITRFEKGGDAIQPTTVLYHATSSAAEVGFELGRTRTFRPFVSIRIDLPWYTTEVEKLTPAPTDSAERGLIFIDYAREWTPVYGVWGGVAL